MPSLPDVGPQCWPTQDECPVVQHWRPSHLWMFVQAYSVRDDGRIHRWFSFETSKYAASVSGREREGGTHMSGCLEVQGGKKLTFCLQRRGARCGANLGCRAPLRGLARRPRVPPLPRASAARRRPAAAGRRSAAPFGATSVGPVCDLRIAGGASAYTYTRASLFLCCSPCGAHRRPLHGSRMMKMLFPRAPSLCGSSPIAVSRRSSKTADSSPLVPHVMKEVLRAYNSEALTAVFPSFDFLCDTRCYTLRGREVGYFARGMVTHSISLRV